jgi:alpha-tubulin suppressor-like RCC1 family protein/uncharacterized protein YjdB
MKVTGSRLRASRLTGAWLSTLVACNSDRFEPPPAEIAYVRVDPENAILPLGSTLQLVAQAIDVEGRAVGAVELTWSSDHPEIISVSGSGVVTAQSPGAATVSASAGGQTGTVLIATVQPVSAVTVAPTPLALAVGESVQLTPLVTNAQGSPVGLAVGWASDNPAVAAVSSQGVVTASAPGTTTITATAGGKTGGATITVSATPVPVSSVTIEPSSLSVAPGGSAQLAVTLRDAAGNVLPGRPVAWSSSSPSVATVSSSGLVIGVAAGSTTITASSEGVDGTGTVAVDPGSAVAAIVISPGNAVLTIGTGLQLTATARDAAGNPLTAHAFTWRSSNPNLARVSESGIVSGVAFGGPVTITAATEGVSATASVTVVPVPASTIVIIPDQVSFVPGGQLRLQARPRDDAGTLLTNRPIVWTSSNPSVAPVSGENVNGVALFGVAQGAALGTATITASVDGVSSSAQVVVTTLSITNISVGRYLTCGLTPQGAAFCWGLDPALGTAQITPVSVPGGLSFTQITAGDQHACGVTAGGTAYCWGDNSNGQLGAGTTPSPACGPTDFLVEACPAPVPVSGGLTFASLTAGGAHTCGLLADGTAYCWGAQGNDQLGNSDAQICGDSSCSSPIEFLGLKFRQLSAGDRYTCGVALDQTAYCWGENLHGQLGGGEFGPAEPVTAVQGRLSFVSVDAGYFHTCGLVAGGLGFCWGDNEYGQLGNGEVRTTESVPTPVFGGMVFSAISAGARVSCGFVPSGTGYCWGQNSQGTLGTGDFSDSPIPVAVAGGHNWVSISVNHNLTTCGVTTDQTGYCWGRNVLNATGTGSPHAYVLNPTRVAGQQ